MGDVTRSWTWKMAWHCGRANLHVVRWKRISAHRKVARRSLAAARGAR